MAEKGVLRLGSGGYPRPRERTWKRPSGQAATWGWASAPQSMRQIQAEDDHPKMNETSPPPSLCGTYSGIGPQTSEAVHVGEMQTPYCQVKP